MRRTTIFVAAALLAAPASALAPDRLTDTALASVAVQGDEDEDEGNSRLGLLGLLGLAGLLGLMRREPDIHVDARREKRD